MGLKSIRPRSYGTFLPRGARVCLPPSTNLPLSGRNAQKTGVRPRKSGRGAAPGDRGGVPLPAPRADQVLDGGADGVGGIGVRAGRKKARPQGRPRRCVGDGGEARRVRESFSVGRVEGRLRSTHGDRLALSGAGKRSRFSSVSIMVVASGSPAFGTTSRVEVVRACILRGGGVARGFFECSVD